MINKLITPHHALFSFLSFCLISTAVAGEQKIGSSLHKKEEISIDNIPKGVLTEVKTLAPNMTINEAEKEYKNGSIYIDVEGELEDGSEIEFDLLKTGDKWQVVEIQRDLTIDQLPKNVVVALESNSPKFIAKRIIESIQHGENITIYEFYGISPQGKEVRKEVKLENGNAEVLVKEWAH